MKDGPFNDLWPWQFHRVPDVLGTGRGFVVETEQQLDEALRAAEQHTSCFCLLEVRLNPSDRSPALQRLAGRMAENV
jgi:indolepyruvate decarboxylase